jgi:hydrogenase/urease accessory protein HupE
LPWLDLPSCSALPRRLAAVFAAIYVGLGPTVALAHSPMPGFEGFYVGMLHPLSTPGQLLALLAVGLMLGHRFPERFAVPWLVFAVALLLGIILGQTGVKLGYEETLLLSMAAAAAALSALIPSGFWVAFVLLCGAAGVSIGLLSTPDAGSFRDTLFTLAGSFVGANLALLYLSGGTGMLLDRFPQRWLHLGFRIVGAWIAAISLMMAAFSAVSV